MTGSPRETGQSAPHVVAVVLNYNGLQHLQYSLPSIAATRYPNLEIVLVDNASTDGSLAYVQAHFPAVTPIASHSNLGWSGGNNLGIDYALERGAAYVALVNTDVRVDPRWIAQAVAAAESDPRIGIVGYSVIQAHGSDDTRAFEEACRSWRGLEVQPSRDVRGMALFARADLYRRIGLIDEGFFAYAEDNDLVLRALKAGYRVVQINVPVWHKGQGSFGKTPLWAARLQIRNNLRLAIKHENAAGIAYQVARHFAKACLPGVRVDPHDAVARRLRPSNVFVNFGIFISAVAWNIVQLPATIRRRKLDHQRSAATARLWKTP